MGWECIVGWDISIRCVLVYFDTPEKPWEINMSEGSEIEKDVKVERRERNG